MPVTKQEQRHRQAPVNQWLTNSKLVAKPTSEGLRQVFYQPIRIIGQAPFLSPHIVQAHTSSKNAKRLRKSRKIRDHAIVIKHDEFLPPSDRLARPAMLQIFQSDSRLFELKWRDEAGPDLPVEAWWGKESLSAGSEYCIDLLSTDAYIELKRFLGRAVTLNTRLSDGSNFARSGLVRAAQKLGADGGFARYRMTVVPWAWLLTRGRHNRVFQERSLVEIVETVFAD
jgi:hypothetical protein